MEAAPLPLANARRQAKYSLQFMIYARHQKILLKRKEYFAWLCSERAGGGAGLYFCSQTKSFLPPTPSTFCLLVECHALEIILLISSNTDLLPAINIL